MDVEATKDEEKKEDGEAEVIEEKKVKKKKQPEPTSFRLSNPSRITRVQSVVCAFDLNQRYRPVRSDGQPLGVIMLTDSKPSEEEELFVVKTPYEEDEAEMPDAFEWAPPGHAEYVAPAPVPELPTAVKEEGKTTEVDEKTTEVDEKDKK
jgi:26S proteasome regulatory subunit N2